MKIDEKKLNKFRELFKEEYQDIIDKNLTSDEFMKSSESAYNVMNNIHAFNVMTEGLKVWELAVLIGTVLKNQDESEGMYNAFKEYLDKFMKFKSPFDE